MKTKRRFYKKRVDGKKEMRKLALLNGVFPSTTMKASPERVTPAFFPCEGTTICHNCGQERTMLISFCEHCDAPYNEFLTRSMVEMESRVSQAVLSAVKNIRREVDRAVKQKGETKMADFGESGGSQSRSKGGDNGGDSFADFIHGSDLPAKGTVTAKITGFREEALEFSQYQLDFTIGKKAYTLGLRDESDGRLRALIKLLGGKTNRWIGKSFKMQRHAKMDRQGNPRIQIVA